MDDLPFVIEISSFVMDNSSFVLQEVRIRIKKPVAFS